MSERKITEAIGWLLMALGGLIVIFRRVAGIDLTEGQLLVQDFPWWVTAAACLLGGAWIIRKAANARVQRAERSEGPLQHAVSRPRATEDNEHG